MGRKFAIFVLLNTLYSSANSKYKPPGGGLIFGGAILTEGFLRYDFGGLTWKGLFSEFYGIQ